MDKYITPNGQEIEESVLRETYGDRFDSLVAEGLLKKKDESELPLENGSLEQSTPQQEVDTTVAEEPISEQDFFTGVVGNTLKNYDYITNFGLGDWVDDMARSVASGYYQGVLGENTADIMLRASGSTEEDILSYIEANKNSKKYGPSAEAQEYNKIYEENGGGVWGVVKGISSVGATMIPEILVNSMVAMATNTDSLIAGSAVVGTTAAVAGATSGGIAAIPAAVAAVPYAFATASAVLEASGTFSELLEEELDGSEMNKENVREILNNKDKLNNIRNKAIARGIAIGVIDAFTGKLATGVSAKILRKAPTVKGAIKSSAVSGGIEFVGATGGETIGSLVAGQELDVSNILLEGIADMPGGIRDVAVARFSNPVSYKINGEYVDVSEIDNIIENFTLQQIQDTNIEIKNDYYGKEVDLDNRKKELSIERDVIQSMPNVNKPTLKAITALQMKLNLLESNNTVPGKKRKAELKNQINELMQSPLQEGVETTNQEALDSLKEKGITEPTEKQVLEELDLLNKTKLDAIQEPSTETVDVSEPTGDSKAVGEGDATSGVAEEVTPQEEQNITEDQTIKEETDVKITEEEKLEKVTSEKVKDLVTAPRKMKEPFILPTPSGRPGSIKINFTEDGKVKSIVNKKDNKEVTGNRRRKAEQLYLKSVVDVNEGQTAQFEEGINAEQANEFIASDSQNIREVTEAIKREEVILENKKGEASDIKGGGGIFGLVGEFFTMESWKEATGIGKKDMDGGFINRWIRTKEKGGKNIKDGAKGYNEEEVVRFIQENPNQESIDKAVNYSKGESNTLIDLKDKFTELTGVNPTPTNIAAVLSVDPGRAPLTAQDKKTGIESERALVEQEGERQITGKQVSAKKIAQGAPKIVKVDEAKALVDQIKLEIKAARDSKLDQTKRRKVLSDAIKDLVKKSSLKIEKVSQLIKRISQVNLNNPVTVEKVLSYVEKTFNDAEYSKKINDAESIRKNIKKLSANKTLEDTAASAVKAFLKVDPLLVENIDAYLKEAEKVKQGVTPTSINKKTGDVKITPAVNIDKTLDYSNSELKRQDKIIYDLQQKAFEDATGLSSDELSLQDMREIVHGMDEDQSPDAREKELNTKAKTKSSIVKKGLKKAFNLYSTLVNQMIETSIDPFTEESISLTKDEKQLVKDFLQIDINQMSDSDTIIALDSLINFATNKTVGGMGKIVYRNEGNVNAKAAQDVGLEAKPLTAITKKADTGIMRAWIKNLASLPMALEFMFKGQSRALMFEKLSGLTGVMNGSAKGSTYSNKIANSYAKKFIKTKPNGQVFNTSFNDTERGMLAFVRRSVKGETDVEFNRRKSLIEQSIVALQERGGKDAAVGNLYMEVYDKILKDSNNISEVEANVDKINLEAVSWMTDIWSENYKDLSRVNLEIYNKTLGDDVNYTPDSFGMLIDSEKQAEIGAQPIFDFGLKKVSDKKTGVLMEAQRPSNLPKDRFINLGFDSQNVSNLERAVIEVNTAGPIQQLKGFFESDSFKKIIPNASDRELITDRVIKYIEAKKGRDYINKTDEKWLKAVNAYSGFAVSRVLGGLTQPIKQVVPVLVNTFVNAGLRNFSPGTLAKMATASDMNMWLQKSGYPIANRGLESITTLDSTRRKLDNAAEGGVEKAVKAVNDLQKTWLKAFLVAPDRYAAQASWMMYYQKNLKKQGIDISNIDWDNHDVNTDAADYAQQQVDRQQNVSDVDLQGNVFTSKKTETQVARKILLAFANFLLNQKTRMYSDVTTITSKTSTKQDKSAALTSISGLIAETIVFNGFGILISETLGMLSSEDDLSEEEKEKIKSNRIKGRATQTVLDILSPIPISQINSPIISLVNSLIELSSKEEEPFQFFEEQPKKSWENLGMFSIPIEKFNDWNELRKLSLYGEYEKEFAGKVSKKEIPGYVKDDMMLNWIAFNLYAIGLLPSEAGTIINNNVRAAKKNEDNQ